MNIAQKFKTLHILPVLTILALSIFYSCDKSSDNSFFLPEYGHKAIVFIHRFNYNDYEQGKKIVIDNFSQAIEGSGQTRRTYFMSEPDSAKVFVVSFFHPNSSTTQWLNSDERDAVLAMLKPLYREPLGVREYFTEFVHNTHLTQDLEPLYLPEQGDEVLVFNNYFNQADYETAKNIISTAYTKIAEDSGQKRRSYTLSDSANAEILGVSFFHPDSKTEDWINNTNRQLIADSLAPLTRVPSSIDRYTLDRAHNSN